MGFGNGAFQAAKIAIDGVTVIENIFTGKIEAPGVTIPSTPSTTTSSYLSIPITNTQNVATPAPFQQLVQLNLNQYPQLSGISSDLSNIYFSSDEAGQNKLYSWRETSASLTSTQTWWVLLPNGIPANGTITIYLQVSSSTALDGVYTGEAPQLSSTYGQYDNGAKIFTNYWNFAGTSLPTPWTTTGTVSITVNNGVTIVSASGIYGGIYTGSTTYNPQDLIVDFYGYTNVFLNNNITMGFGYNSITSTPCYAIGNGTSGYGYNLYNSTTNGTIYSGVVASLGTQSTNTLYILSLWITSSATYGSVNYATPVSLNMTYPTVATEPLYAYGVNQTSYLQLVRTRAIPPNGVMPALQAPTVKAIQSIITSTSNTWTAAQTYTAPQNINVGQTELTGTTAGSIVYSMPYQGTIYKKFIAYASGYENDTTTAQTISFPVAFVNTPYVVTAPSGLISSTTTTGITLASGSTTTYTGWIIMEGY